MITNQTHTPSPWHTDRKDEGKVIIDLPGDGAILILGYNTEANARLIAAAPDLLAALEFCHTRLFNYQAGMDEIRDPEITRQLNEVAIVAARIAIAKAKG